MKMQENLVQNEQRIFQGEHLSAIDFPVGGVGGSVIRLNGHAQRQWWHIFNNNEEREGSGFVPNSFFSIRTRQGDATVVRALQTVPVGPFEPMKSLTFRCAFPFGWYDFADTNLPVSVSLEAYSFLIPMDLKSSAIPSAIFRYTVKNPGTAPVQVSLLAAQQNAVGFNGYDPVAGPENRSHAGYGSNRNQIVAKDGRTVLQMTGAAGSMALSSHESGMTGCAAWQDLTGLHADFEADGQLSGTLDAKSPEPGVTIDGAIAKAFELAPGAERTVTFVLSWHIPNGSFGAKGGKWHADGCQYENWWTDAMAVDDHVQAHFKELDGQTRLYHSALFNSNVPGYVLDRISSNIAVLKSPTAFWGKNGYFGLWESTSSKEVWSGNCKHVYHYAQGHARLFPELGRLLRTQDLQTMTPDGLLPARVDKVPALDGHFGTILGIYREHLLSSDDRFLKGAWERTRIGMDHAISKYDPDQDGMLTGSYHNTLDCNVSGTSPWIGSLYLAALRASSRMAELVGDADSATRYTAIFETGRKNQEVQLWDDKLGYYKEKAEKLPDTRVMADSVSIDMFLGQWWANQLALGQIYPENRTLAGLRNIYTTNRITDDGKNYGKHFRDFLGTGDTGWQMFVHQGPVPKDTILYYCECMSGFEYSFAATLIQSGLVQEGLEVVKAIHDRYDGRLRAKGEVSVAENATVFGCGSPVGEDECGDFYGRAMSSWSVLLALQGFQYDGPRGSITFKPVWQPGNHVSFFTAAEGWGVFTQRREAGVQSERIELNYGSLKIRELVVEVPAGTVASTVTMKIGNRAVDVKTSVTGPELHITASQAMTLQAGEVLDVEIR